MDRKAVLKLKSELGEKPGGSSERLVIHVAPHVAGPAAPPSPETFATRKDYRRALIDFENSVEQPGLDSLVERLKAMGLATTSSRRSHTVVVEGPTEILIRALDEHGIEHADLDRQMDLIVPDRRKGR